MGISESINYFKNCRKLSCDEPALRACRRHPNTGTKAQALLLCAGWGCACSDPWLLSSDPVGLAVEALYSCANCVREILEEAVSSLTVGQGCYYCVSGCKFELLITPQQGKPSVGQGFV